MDKQHNNKLLADTTRAHILTNIGHAFGFLGNAEEERQQKFSEAEKLYKKIIEAPNRTDIEKMRAYNGLGVCFGHQEKYEEAVDCFEKVIQANTRNRPLNINTNRDYLTARDITLAYAYRNKGVALINLGKNTKRKEHKEKYDTKKNYEDAIDCFRKSLNIIPRLATAWNGKGVAQFILTDYDRAVNYFRKALEVTELANAYYNEGRAYHQEKDFDKAIECFNNAIRIYPMFAHAYVSKGVSLGKKAENKSLSNEQKIALYSDSITCFDEAIEHYKTTNSNDVGYSDAYRFKGYALLNILKENDTRRYYEVMECFDKVTDFFKSPKSIGLESIRKVILSHALNGKGAGLYALGEEEESIRCFDEAEKCGEYITTTKFNKARYEYERGHILEALDYFREIESDSNAVMKSQIHNNIGLCYFDLGMHEEAEKEYLEAQRAYSKLAEPYYNLGVLYNKASEPDKAQRMFEACLRADYKFTKAKEALEKLEYAARKTADWYEWWFVSSSVYKKALGVTIIAFIITLFLTTLYFSFTSLSLGSTALNLPFLEDMLGIDLQQGENGPSTESSSSSSSTAQDADQSETPVQTASGAVSNTISSFIVILIVLIGIFMIVLFLPSLRTIKVGSVELTTASDSVIMNTNEIKQEPSLSQQTPPTLYFHTTAISDIIDDAIMNIEDIWN